MTSKTMPELYETLTSGGKFRMRFDCREDARDFRNRLATHKFRVEKDLKDMGVIEHMTLSMDYDSVTNIATLYLRAPDDVAKPTFEILEVIPPNNPQQS